MIGRNLLIRLALIALCCASIGVGAEQVRIASASNFTAPMRALADAFEQQTEYRTQVSFASSGKLYAQIAHGAPYDVFFSADQDKPIRLVEKGLALSHSQFTYAVGVLALWSGKHSTVAANPDNLVSANYQRLALANPKLAPFGVAAMEVIQALGADKQVFNRVIKGDNVAQAYQFVHSGNAELGFVALSQVVAQKDKDSTVWIVPTHLHQPIYQDAVVLTRGERNPAAIAFNRFVQSEQAQAIIRKFGYHQKTDNDT